MIISRGNPASRLQKFFEPETLSAGTKPHESWMNDVLNFFCSFFLYYTTPTNPRIYNFASKVSKDCIGKPEPLKGDLSGFWSAHIDEKNRIVFRIEDDKLEIWQCGSLP